jgi:hypothetical protein
MEATAIASERLIGLCCGMIEHMAHYSTKQECMS